MELLFLRGSGERKELHLGRISTTTAGRGFYDLHCVTRWSKFGTRRQGIQLKTLFDEKIIVLKPGAKYVIQHAEGRFTSNLPLEVAASDTFLLATQYEGEPISPEHGYPLRGLIGAIPGKRDLKDVYLWNGAKGCADWNSAAWINPVSGNRQATTTKRISGKNSAWLDHPDYI